MEATLLFNFFDKYGWPGLLVGFICFYVWYHHIRPKKEFKRGHFISDKNIEKIESRITRLEEGSRDDRDRFERHMSKQQLEDIRMEQFDLGIKQMKDEVNKLYAHNDNIWTSLDEYRKDVRDEMVEIRTDIKKILIMMTHLSGNND